MKYIVSMKVDGRLDVEVEADTPEEAFEKANDAFENMESAELVNMDVVDSEPVNCTDEDGNLTDR